MIMMLSCFDLVAVITNYPGTLVYLISWLRQDYDFLAAMTTYLLSATVFPVFSFHTLLVMSIERYLGAYYPFFHRTSVTRRRLLTLLAILLMTTTVVYIISSTGTAISRAVFLAIFVALFFPPFMFANFKLLAMARKVTRKRTVPPGQRTTVNLKNISVGLWAVACFMLFSIPASFFITFSLTGKSTKTINMSFIWALTCSSMNCTLNSLIFFWKNKVLRTEGIKILKTLKDRIVGS